MLVRLGGNGRQVFNTAQYVGILHDDAARLAVDGGKHTFAVGLRRQFGQCRIERVAGIFRHRFGNADIMRVQARREHRLAPLGHAARHADGFPAGGRAVIHRRIGNIAAVQPRDLRLELEQHLQRALRDFGLIGRVGGQELAALDDMIDDAGT